MRAASPLTEVPSCEALLRLNALGMTRESHPDTQEILLWWEAWPLQAFNDKATSLYSLQWEEILLCDLLTKNVKVVGNFLFNFFIS